LLSRNDRSVRSGPSKQDDLSVRSDLLGVNDLPVGDRLDRKDPAVRVYLAGKIHLLGAINYIDRNDSPVRMTV
jgi:hypothetical protein